jgi:hypothetical protein
MKINKIIKVAAARLAIGGLFQCSALAGPATYLYWQQSPLPYKHTSQAARQCHHQTIAAKTTQKVKWCGMPHLLTVGQAVISIDQFDQ